MNRHTDITPHGSQVQNVVPPDDGVNKLDEARDRRPDDVGASANIPCLNMPWERDEDNEETEEGKDGKKRISGIDIHVHGGEERKEETSGACLYWPQTKNGSCQSILCPCPCRDLI